MWQVEVGSPQFYGIVAGCVVYVVTVAAVLLLLFKSGSIARMIDEVSPQPRLARGTGLVSVCVCRCAFEAGLSLFVALRLAQIKQGKPIGKSDANLMPLRATLFDELIAARGSLPVQPNLPSTRLPFLSVCVLFCPSSSSDLTVTIQQDWMASSLRWCPWSAATSSRSCSKPAMAVPCMLPPLCVNCCPFLHSRVSSHFSRRGSQTGVTTESTTQCASGVSFRRARSRTLTP